MNKPSHDILDKYAQRFAEKHDLDANTIKLSMIGVIERVIHAEKQGEKVTPELIQAAFIHWYESQAQMYQDLLDNKDGAMDKFADNVFNELRAKIEADKQVKQ